jgi:hypothetical protein
MFQAFGEELSLKNNVDYFLTVQESVLKYTGVFEGGDIMQD